jgi:hypothetical protein
MALRSRVSLILLAIAAFSLGCKQMPRQPSAQLQIARPASTAAASPAATIPAQLQPAAQQASNASAILPAAQASAAPAGSPQLEDAEERRGPFSIAGQTFTVLLHYKRLTGSTGAEAQTLASIEIVNAAGEVQYREAYPYSAEAKDHSKSCAADVQYLEGSNGKGLLLDVGCLPSAPLAGGPWEIFGVVNGKLIRIGKPLVTEGELGNFVPGAISRIGTATQILPDMLQIRVWTGYFFATAPVRVDWFQGKLALAQHCFYQTGHGFAEDGCEMPVEKVERTPSEQDMTFVRLFAESDEHTNPPAHMVVKKDSQVEILAAKVLITWDDARDVISLGVGDDIWFKARIDGKEGWIHTIEDLNAIGLYQSG